MNIHEYQTKSIFKKYGIPILKGKLALNAKEALDVAKDIGGNCWVIKAQVHAGGRGKGGGVKIAKSIDEVFEFANQIIGMRLVTPQTSKEGKLVKKIYIEQGVDIKDEYYLALMMDRAKEMPIIVISSEGGMDIEEVAKKSPKSIVKVPIDPSIGCRDFYIREIAFRLKLEKNKFSAFSKIIKSLYKMFIDTDATLIEINPFVELKNGSFIALDAKGDFDSNALFRHKDIANMEDKSEEDPSETKAKEYGLSYVKLDGNIACMVNGAGLAMATMDMIYEVGGSPANFLDVGGNATIETIAKSLRIILEDKKVKSIFVNIFGGIVRCDRIALGILDVIKKKSIDVPIVIRLVGTNSPKAREILKEANIKNLISCDNMKDGAMEAISAVTMGKI